MRVICHILDLIQVAQKSNTVLCCSRDAWGPQALHAIQGFETNAFFCGLILQPLRNYVSGEGRAVYRCLQMAYCEAYLLLLVRIRLPGSVGLPGTDRSKYTRVALVLALIFDTMLLLLI